jgi:hypothetical protein
VDSYLAFFHGFPQVLQNFIIVLEETPARKTPSCQRTVEASCGCPYGKEVLNQNLIWVFPCSLQHCPSHKDGSSAETTGNFLLRECVPRDGFGFISRKGILKYLVNKNIGKTSQGPFEV